MKTTTRWKEGYGARLKSAWPLLGLALLLGGFICQESRADVIGLNSFVVTNTKTDGTVAIAGSGSALVLTGGNDGSGLPGSTEFLSTAPLAGMLQFNYLYTSLDDPGYDSAGYRLGDDLVQLADEGGMTGSLILSVSKGEIFGWWVNTTDNSGEAGALILSGIDFTPTTVPEPTGFALGVIGIAGIAAVRRKYRPNQSSRKTPLQGYLAVVAALVLFGNGSVFAQSQNHYLASDVTGQLALARTINPLLLGATRALGALVPAKGGPEVSKIPTKFPPPTFPRRQLGALRPAVVPLSQSLPVGSISGVFGFTGISHYEQRQANSGNQFSVEPPNPSVAVANGFILEGVNNAVRVYNASGGGLLRVLSSNELFGVSPAINRVTGINGVFPTDMRVYFDQDISRWFVLQRSQDNDIYGNPTNQSHLYMAVSRTADPTGVYNIYVMDTTNAQNPGCPCVADFPQIGSDQYGFYISANEYNTFSQSFNDAIILAISKASLATGASAPPVFRFIIPRFTGFEFSIQPATTPPGGSHFLANGGVEYFVSSQSSSFDANLAIWAMSNTASLQSASPSLLLTQTMVPTLNYFSPDVATQRPGPLPYGSTLVPPGALAFIDGADSRILSAVYAGGRLFTTLSTEVRDDNGHNVVGGAYVIFSPTLRSGVLAASVLQQGYLVTNSNHILRPAVAVNAQGRGAIAFTLVGPDYFPSAAFVGIDGLSAPSEIRIARTGKAPEDGFTGYPGGFFPGIARWGDYSTVTASTDGSIWMVSEFIPASNLPGIQLANWGTFVSQFLP